MTSSALLLLPLLLVALTTSPLPFASAVQANGCEDDEDCYDMKWEGYMRVPNRVLMKLAAVCERGLLCNVDEPELRVIEGGTGYEDEFERRTTSSATADGEEEEDVAAATYDDIGTSGGEERRLPDATTCRACNKKCKNCPGLCENNVCMTGGDRMLRALEAAADDDFTNLELYEMGQCIKDMLNMLNKDTSIKRFRIVPCDV